MNDHKTPVEKVSIDVITLIRLLELTREDIKDDATLHRLAQAIVDTSRGDHTITMDDYNRLMNRFEQSKSTVKESNYDFLNVLLHDFENEPGKHSIETGNDAAHQRQTYTPPKQEYEYKSYRPRTLKGVDHQSFTKWIYDEQKLRRTLMEKFNSPKLDMTNCIRLYTEHNLKIDDSFTMTFPIEQVYKYREYDREILDNFTGKMSADEFNELKRSIAVDGIHDYGVMIVIQKGGARYAAYLGEGNHRLNIARQLGFETFPIRFGYTYE